MATHSNRSKDARRQSSRTAVPREDRGMSYNESGGRTTPTLAHPYRATQGSSTYAPSMLRRSDCPPPRLNIASTTLRGSPRQPRSPVEGVFAPVMAPELFDVHLEAWEVHDPDDDEVSYQQQNRARRKAYREENLRIMQTMQENEARARASQAQGSGQSRPLREAAIVEPRHLFRADGRGGTSRSAIEDEDDFDLERVRDIAEVSEGFVPLRRFGPRHG